MHGYRFLICLDNSLSISYDALIGHFLFYLKLMVLTNLVTGGAGFLGSHLIDTLIEQGQDVICLDNYFTGRKSNISHLLGHSSFELIRHDVTLPITLEVDRIWHLACPASPIHYQSNPVKTAKTSFLGTYNMLGLARRTGARLLLASTSEVYGDPQVHPQNEAYRGNVNPIGIRSCYDEGKRIAETLCFDYMRMNDVDVRVMRIFNTYGPRMLPDDGRVVSNFIVQALQGKPLTLYGGGSQTRSFCYVNDLINGMTLMMNSDYPGPINIGNPVEFTIRQLAEMVIARINPSLELRHMPLPQDDPLQRCPDISLASSILGWTPSVSLEDGLSPTIEFFRKICNLS